MNKKFLLLSLAMAISFTASTSAFAEAKSPIIGKGSLVSKRASLTRITGKAKMHKARIIAIMEKYNK